MHRDVDTHEAKCIPAFGAALGIAFIFFFSCLYRRTMCLNSGISLSCPSSTCNPRAEAASVLP